MDLGFGVWWDLALGGFLGCSLFGNWVGAGVDMGWFVGLGKGAVSGRSFTVGAGQTMLLVPMVLVRGSDLRL